MPTIVVTSKSTTELEAAVTLEETVEPEHMASKHHAAQLLERMRWAVTDAKDAELEEE